MMFCEFVGLTAILVSLCGAGPSQSVLTFAAFVLLVEQITPDADLGVIDGTFPSPSCVMGPSSPLNFSWVSGKGSGLSAALAMVILGPRAKSISASAMVTNTTTRTFIDTSCNILLNIR